MQLNGFGFWTSQILNVLEHCLLSIDKLATECFIVGTGDEKRTFNYLCKYIFEVYRQTI